MDCKLYRAFGLTIASEFPMVQVPEIASGEADVRIVRRTDLSDSGEQDVIFFQAGDVAYIRVTGGKLIEVQPLEGSSGDHLSVYLMGSAMGAVLHQRDFLPLHGSCVTNGTQSIFITGDSGAGKSTLAAEFLRRGWKLITDDVSALFGLEKGQTPMVQSSYPSQKLWQDSLEHYERPQKDIHSLYARDDREKFGVDVTRFFYDGAAPLTLIVRLIPADGPCRIAPIQGMAKTDQLMRNTYRAFMIEESKRPRHFQRCVTMAGRIPMALVLRQKDRQCAGQLYDMIIDYLGREVHGS